MSDPGVQARRDPTRSAVLILPTSLAYSIWFYFLGPYELIGAVLLGVPLTAFIVVPLHLRLQSPPDSSALLAFGTWLASGAVGLVWIWLLRSVL
jgi:hypothetical protein